MADQDTYDLSNDALQEVGEMQQQMNTYLSGVRSALGVPEGYVLDLREGAFVPPETGDETGEETPDDE